MTVEFTHSARDYSVNFDVRQLRTANLQKRRLLQTRKSRTKRAADPATRRCTHCTVKEGDLIIAYGMSICSPVDRFNKKEGQIKALRRAIQQSRLNSKRDRKFFSTHELNKEWAVEAWQALFNSQTINVLAL